MSLWTLPALLVGYGLGHLLWPVTVRFFLRREARRMLAEQEDDTDAHHCRGCDIPLLVTEVGDLCTVCEMEARADRERPTLSSVLSQQGTKPEIKRAPWAQVQTQQGLVEITTLGDRYGRFMCPHDGPPCMNCVDELADRLLQERLGYGREPTKVARMFARAEARRDLS